MNDFYCVIAILCGFSLVVFFFLLQLRTVLCTYEYANIYIYINVEIFQTVINLCAFLRICETIILLFVEKEYWVQLSYYIISQENIIFSGQATYISLVQQQGNYCHWFTCTKPDYCARQRRWTIMIVWIFLQELDFFNNY